MHHRDSILRLCYSGCMSLLYRQQMKAKKIEFCFVLFVSLINITNIIIINNYNNNNNNNNNDDDEEKEEDVFLNIMLACTFIS